MSINETPSSERIHIAFFGLRNAGKSSLVNAVTGQNISLVSDIKGTTTDPVKKAMELLPLGPVVIIDTPGIDDEGVLGEMRVERAKSVLSQTDIAVLVRDITTEITDTETRLLKLFEANKIPFLIVLNKTDLLENIKETQENEIAVSAKDGKNIFELKEKLATLIKSKDYKRYLISDLLTRGDTVVLVMPIDDSAPKGRIILPQVQTIRDILDAGCTAVCCQDDELEDTLKNLSHKPRLVVTDSQIFSKVSKIVAPDIPLTSFSILFARYKGNLVSLTRGAKAIKNLKDGDFVLISEGCTHHRQCGDIGTVKMPRWIKDFCGAEPIFEFTSGTEFPRDLSKYSLVVHCGGCMLNEREMQSRLNTAEMNHIPIVNYGVAIALMHGILIRSLDPFPEAAKILSE